MTTRPHAAAPAANTNKLTLEEVHIFDTVGRISEGMDEESANFTKTHIHADDADTLNLPLKQEKARSARPLFRFLAELGLFSGSIIAWYLSNGMNGIALQTFSTRIRDEMTLETTQTQFVLAATAAMTLVTTVQLILAGIAASLALYLINVFYYSTPLQTGVSSLVCSAIDMRSASSILNGTLHSIGSLATNLGFMYGSASLIQMLKLLEPFETLLLSQCLIPEETKATPGVVASMFVLVGAALSLVRLRPGRPNPLAVMFSIISGVSLSLRNVSQRQRHIAQIQRSQQQLEDGHPAGENGGGTGTIRRHPPSGPLGDVLRSLENFARLSIQSSVVSLTVTITSHLLASQLLSFYSTLIEMTLLHALHWRVLTWHPLYNAFSMITLGFCSALTHSLLNAGKRVFAILMAIVWFHEALSKEIWIGLLAVVAGGWWYSAETKKAKKKGSSKSTQVSGK